jgi:hypothetical protein
MLSRLTEEMENNMEEGIGHGWKRQRRLGSKIEQNTGERENLLKAKL